MSENNYTETDTCQQRTVTYVGVGEYTTDASTLNKNYYLKHDVVNDIITSSYVCFVTDTEHCMQGGTSYYAANKTLLQSQESWFTGQSGACNFDINNSQGIFSTSATYSNCNSSALSASAGSNGAAYAGVSDSVGCGVTPDGNSICSVSSSGAEPVEPDPGGGGISQ